LNDAWILLLCWVVVLGLTGFALMGFDKRRARTGGWRVPERTFYELSLIGGALGVVAGAFVFHHKTSKALFFGVVIVLAICWIALLNELQALLGAPFG
jgi:uncharacterized membrane protein YsdA (DUF1294 family)